LGLLRHRSERARATLDRLLDLGAGRIADMDATGIDKAVLALTSPGVQAYTDAEEARLTPRRPTICWPRLRAPHPLHRHDRDRAAGPAMERGGNPARGAVGFKGVLVNSHTHGEYLDEPKFDPIFRALADVGQPLYIHPTTPPDSMIGPMLEAGLDGAVFGFGVETGLHLLRLIRASSTAIPISRSSWAMRARPCPTGSTG
jgi:2,3-dihydroxybenzoate decarboxylase